MSTTKGAPSSRSFISFTVSPESARFCNCCSTVCLVERTFALLKLFWFPLSPHQMLASLKSLLLLVFTGFIGLEVIWGWWCEAIVTLSESLLTHVTSSTSVSQLRLTRQLRTVRVTSRRVCAPGPGLMSDPTSDEGWTREWRGLLQYTTYRHGWMKIARNYPLQHLQKWILQQQIVNCSADERSAVCLASSWMLRLRVQIWMEDCGGEWRHPSLGEIMQWQTSGTLAWLLH